MTTKPSTHSPEAAYAVKREPTRTIAPVFRIERRPAVGLLKEAVDRIHTLLNTQLADLQAEVPSTGSHMSDPSFGGFGSAAALDRHIAEWKKNQPLRTIKTMDVVLPVNTTRVVGPPFDHGWATGSGAPLSELDGAAYIFASDGSSGSGFAIDLSSPDEVFASVTPAGQYSFNWASFGNYPSISFRGGVGMLAYQLGTPATLIKEAQAVLFSVNGVTSGMGDQGTGLFQQATISEGGIFGQVPIAPFDLELTPGSTYQVWMWTWFVGQGIKGTALLSEVDLKVPFVSLATQPPIVVR